MKCPWCWKKISWMKRIDKDPDNPVPSPNGAPFLCAGCHQLSIVINDGKALRKPTQKEAHAMATSQALADQLPEGVLTMDDMDHLGHMVRGGLKQGSTVPSAGTVPTANDFTADICKWCGTVIGHGIPAFHLGVCDDPQCQQHEKTRH